MSSETGSRPVFYYDLYSPYAYLAAMRVDEALPVAPRWEPIFFGGVLREIGRTPWSLRPGEREQGQQEVERRARERGLPEVRWPPGWPAASYDLRPIRAVLWATREDERAGKALACSLYERVFAEGRPLNEPGTLRESVAACGLEVEALEAAAEQEEAKAELRAKTDEAIARGLTGIPTIAVGDVLYWGDDRLEEAADAIGRAGR